MGLRYVEKLEKKCLDFSEFLLTYLWIVRKAVVLVHPVERASQIMDASKQVKLLPPYSSLTLIPGKDINKQDADWTYLMVKVRQREKTQTLMRKILKNERTNDSKGMKD